MITGNKGEWSEFYAFIKLIVDKNIVGANEDLSKNENIVFPVLKIIREEPSGKSVFEILEGNKISVSHLGGEAVVVDGSDLKTKVVSIFEAINVGSKTFSVPIASELLDRFGINALNAGNAQKEDLILEIHDYNIGKEHEVGFSIKSKLGSPATLLNASSATNFVYKITGLNDIDMNRINSIDTRSKIKDRLTAILNSGCIVEFNEVCSDVFERNLRKIDTVMPEIIGEMVLEYYSSGGSDFNSLIKSILKNGTKIMSFDLSGEDYAYKIKALLYNAALGMVPAGLWDGNLRAHGGVIIVRTDGEIVCYHLYNAESFRNYLFGNTRLDSPSSTRHKYGVIYEKDGEKYINLNLQIRFNK